VALKTVSIVPEVVFGIHWPVIQDGIFSTLNDFVPQNNLIDDIVLRFIFRSEVQKELFDVPVEKRREISLKIEGKKSEIILLSGRTVIGDMFDDNFDGVHLGMSGVFQEESGQEADKSQAG